MDWMQIALAIIGQAFAAGAIYAGMKAGIVRAIEKAEGAQATADKAHQRIDTLLLR